MNTGATLVSAKRPQRNWAQRTHSTVAIFSLVLIIILAVTGIALNHATELGLDRKFLSGSLVARWYNIKGEQPATGFQTEYGLVTLAGDLLFLGDKYISTDIPALLGAVSVGGNVVAATTTSLIVITPEGRLVDTVALDETPIDTISRLGLVRDVLAIAGGEQLFALNSDLLNPKPSIVTDASNVVWAAEVSLEAKKRDEFGNRSLARTVTMDRALADIHSGRLFPGIGRWIMDLAGLALLYLSCTGVVLYFRRRNRRIR